MILHKNSDEFANCCHAYYKAALLSVSIAVALTMFYIHCQYLIVVMLYYASFQTVGRSVGRSVGRLSASRMMEIVFCDWLKLAGAHTECRY